MQKLVSRREVNSLILLLITTYMVSYITRINFGAVVSEIASDTGISKSALSMSLTGSFITYGAGQILSGILGDRISPKKLVSLGLTVTIAMNFLIPVCTSPYQMLLVWCVNGLAQALMWPPMVRMLSALLNADDYRKAVTKVNWGGSFGTIFVYLAGPAIIMMAGWKGVFYFAAAGAVMLILWNVRAKDIRPEPKQKVQPAQKSGHKAEFPIVLFFVMAAIILHGMLRDGVTTWMPSFVAESFGLGNEISILTGVLLPIFSILSLQVTGWLYRKKIQNPLSGASLLFGLGTVCALALYLLCGKSVVGSVVFSAALTGCMHGVNLLLVCMVPQFFEKNGNISTVSGMLNACTYIGSAVFTYGVAALSDSIGWQKTIFLWLLIALVGSLICLCCVRPWKKTMMHGGNDQ